MSQFHYDSGDQTDSIVDSELLGFAKSSAEQRQIFCLGGSVGVYKGPSVAGENDKRGEPALAAQERGKEATASLFL